jgi:hypothetical protein
VAGVAWAFPYLTVVTVVGIAGILLTMAILPGQRLELWLSISLAVVLVVPAPSFSVASADPARHQRPRWYRVRAAIPRALPDPTSPLATPECSKCPS